MVGFFSFLSQVYNAIRIFIAAYVWMTGFGNFSCGRGGGWAKLGRPAGSMALEPCTLTPAHPPLLPSYYYVKADFSLGRFAQMMWRLNFFVFFTCVPVAVAVVHQLLTR